MIVVNCKVITSLNKNIKIIKNFKLDLKLEYF